LGRVLLHLRLWWKLLRLLLGRVLLRLFLGQLSQRLLGLLGGLIGCVSGAGFAIIANVAPDVEAEQDEQDKEYDYFKAAEVGCKFFEIGSYDSTQVG